MPPCEGELVQVAENLIVEAGTQLREGLTVKDIKDITINHNKKYFFLIMIINTTSLKQASSIE